MVTKDELRKTIKNLLDTNLTLEKENTDMRRELDNKSADIAKLRRLDVTRAEAAADEIGRQAAGFESQIDGLNRALKSAQNAIEHINAELEERESTIALHVQDTNTTSNQFNDLKQQLYNEQIKSTAYMSVIKELHITHNK